MIGFLLAFVLGFISALAPRALRRLLGPKLESARANSAIPELPTPRESGPSLLQIIGHPAHWIANSKRLAGQQGDRNQGERKQGLREIR